METSSDRTTGRKCRSEKEWREIIEGKDASGLSIRDYCKSVGIAPTQFYKYQRRLAGIQDTKAAKNRAPPTKQFIELGVAPLPSPSPVCPWAMELELASGITIRVRG